jgi:hypothetical protein
VQAVILAGGADLAGGFSEIYRGPSGDARCSSRSSANPLGRTRSEFFGDYNSAVATNGKVYALWTDVRRAESLDAVNAYRMLLRTSSGPVPQPDVPADSRFGNSDIYSYVGP